MQPLTIVPFDECDTASAFDIVEAHRHIVHTGDGADETQSQPVARRMAARLAAIEAPQHRLALLVSDARAVIGDAHAHAGLVTKQFEQHVPAGGCELDRILREIGDRLEQQARIALQLERGRAGRAAS